MRIGVIKERRAHEARIAVSPETVKKLHALGAETTIESGAGAGASFGDEALAAAGARIVPDAAAALAEADIVLKVQRPLLAHEGGIDEVALIRPGAALIGILAPYASGEHVAAYAARRID